MNSLSPLRFAFLGLLVLQPVWAERMRPEEEPKEVGLTSVGDSYFPTPENVEFFPSHSAALYSGYRPRKRCRPMEEPERVE